MLTVILPVAGRPSARADRSPDVAVVRANPAFARAGVVRLLREPRWRHRLGQAHPLPPLARAASPGLADAVVRACRGNAQVGLHVMRAYLAPVGIAAAERLGISWVTLDLDEDDSAMATSSGDTQTAAAYDRLLAIFGPLFDGLSAAASPEARGLSSRHALSVDHVPNAVDVPAGRRRPGGEHHGHVSLLFVGNLTYQPNVEAAATLAEEILPEVQRRVARPVRVTLAGRHLPELARLAGPGVEITGFVPDLDPLYARADVVVVPLRQGGGTRIKLLEAFAHRVPVVASHAAAAGLEVRSGRHLLIADDPGAAGMAIETLLTTQPLAAQLVEEAYRLVRRRYCMDAVAPEVRAFFARAADRARARAQAPVLP